MIGMNKISGLAKKPVPYALQAAKYGKTMVGKGKTVAGKLGAKVSQSVSQRVDKMSPRAKSIAKIAGIFTGGAAAGATGAEAVHKIDADA